MFGRSTGTFDRLVEKATSQLLLEPDWDSILQICDAIRGGDVPAKHALLQIKKKINLENPHVCMFALQTLESCVKNCGAIIHQEVATKEFMEYLKDTVKVRPDPVKTKILELIQVWSNAFRNESSYKVVQDTYHLMKMEGYPFPTLKEADAMFKAETAPEWKDGEVCHRCRVQFTMVQRKHHCRNCGQVFCGKCSSKSSIIPKYGIEKEVRVCDACFETLNKGLLVGKKSSEDELPAEYLASPLSQQSQSPPQKSEQELQEEEELQLAIALSKSEAENKQKERDRLRSSYSSYGSSTTASDTSAPSSAVYAQPTTVVAPMLDTSDMDPELARYLNRNYWEKKSSDDQQKTSTTTPSAPTAANEPKAASIKVTEKYQNGEVDDQEQFLNALRSSIEIFCNRMRSNQARGRSIANDSSVQTLFMTINTMHPQLMQYMQKQEDARSHYEALQDKLAQIRDAREALDALRDEYTEKKRREQEELERQRQIQMAHKLEIMRQKKQEYLEYQRQLALQRMQEQERELQMRIEQQRSMQQMRIMQQYQQYPGYPQGAPGQPPQGFSPGGSLEGSPLHRPQQPGMGVAYGQQPPMGGPPGPVPPMVGGPPTQPPPPMAGQPGAPGAPPTTQPLYNQGGFPPGHPGGQAPSQPPGGYQPPGFQQPPTSIYQGQGQGFQQPQPPAPSHGAPMGAPAPGGYNMQPGMEYGAYNMQGMANSLPGHVPPQHGGQPQFMPPAQGQFPPGGAPPPPGIPQGGPPPGQQQPPAPQGNEAELISFD